MVLGDLLLLIDVSIASIKLALQVFNVPNLHDIIHMVTHRNEQIEKPRSTDYRDVRAWHQDVQTICCHQSPFPSAWFRSS